MAKISKVSCVKFVPYEEDIHSQFVRFQTSADGCWTKTVGRPMNGPSVVNIGDGCGSGKKILHEVLHSVGMFHTHQRHDRDDYIVVNTSNISPGNAAGFKQLTKTQFPDLGVAYDCRSIMHYPKKFFSVNQENTIDAKDGGNCTTVGPENAKMTENDILWLNLFYQCPKV
ncbi:astacin-like metalloprotease toxin 4 [Eurytemora carolleeae]|uniref:astacin-like metalloprotease toxin 4 n=1 Tax=Eurytemora carolleeae TaxID=1294199 RepID=UPI000C77F20E|nr:astacin-like metalloprotease toxin 4 [Eurytemora carolleeae]|eukprot:XP_023344750.1 astacin-like metalloprotease toxin 4 [Eurytemora affinis]